jgi:hypothetical protein
MIRMMILLIAVCCVTACNHPSVKYGEAPAAITDPSAAGSGPTATAKPDSKFPFFLRTTTLILAQPTARSSTGQPNPAAEQRVTAPQRPAAREAGILPTPSAPADNTGNSSGDLTPRDACPPSPSHPGDCLEGTTLTSAPAEDYRTMYEIDSVHHDIWHWGTTLDLSVSYVDGTHLLNEVGIKSVDNRATILKQLGESITAGFAVGGPYGAAAAGVLTIAASVIREAGLDAKTALKPYLCTDKGMAGWTDTPKHLLLPVAITLSDAKATGIQPQGADANTELGKLGGCWAPLPRTENTGWLYQLTFTRPEIESRGTIVPALYFGRAGTVVERDSLPYSNCQSVTLRVAWWKDLADSLTTGSSADIRSYASVVADPDRLRAMRLPQTGTITMGKVCGANLKIDSASSANNAAVVDALFTAAKAIKEAQDPSKANTTSGAKR